MSDDQTTPESTEAPPEDQADDQPQTPESPNAEAAKYRHRAKEAEAERDALRDRLTNLQRAAVESKVKESHIAAQGFWASGVQLEDLLDEDGNVDGDKVEAAADTAIKELGLERIGTRGPHVPKEGRVTRPSGTKSWEAAFGAQ